MSEAAAGSRWRGPALGLLVVVVLLGLVLSSANLRQLLIAAAAQVTVLSVTATLPAQLAATLLCAAALLVLRPGVGFWGCLGSRVLRDASGNLPVSLPGFSAAVGARALVLAGGETRAAISASALDKTAEIAGQIPFILLAAVVLWREWQVPFSLPARWPLIVTGLAAAAMAALWVWSRFGAGSRLAVRLVAEWRKFASEARRQRAGLPASTFLHAIAWLTGGVQVWMVAGALGFELSLFEAIAVESAAYAGRAVFFFIPAGLGTQEAGLVAAGLVFGLSPEQALAIGLVLRLRDVLLAAGLVLWPLLEWRRRQFS